MSTELDRASAKGAIVSRQDNDPGLDEVLSSAHRFQLHSVKEQNRHAEEMRGVLSRVFGQGDNATVYVAAFALAIGLCIAIGCYVAIAFDHSQMDFWSKQAERAFAFSGTCLAFIFGKGLSKGSSG